MFCELRSTYLVPTQLWWIRAALRLWPVCVSFPPHVSQLKVLNFAITRFKTLWAMDVFNLSEGEEGGERGASCHSEEEDEGGDRGCQGPQDQEEGGRGAAALALVTCLCVTCVRFCFWSRQLKHFLLFEVGGGEIWRRCQVEVSRAQGPVFPSWVPAAPRQREVLLWWYILFLFIFFPSSFIFFHTKIAQVWKDFHPALLPRWPGELEYPVKMQGFVF